VSRSSLSINNTWNYTNRDTTHGFDSYCCDNTNRDTTHCLDTNRDAAYCSYPWCIFSSDSAAPSDWRVSDEMRTSVWYRRCQCRIFYASQLSGFI